MLAWLNEGSRLVRLGCGHTMVVDGAPEVDHVRSCLGCKPLVAGTSRVDMAAPAGVGRHVLAVMPLGRRIRMSHNDVHRTFEAAPDVTDVLVDVIGEFVVVTTSTSSTPDGVKYTLLVAGEHGGATIGGYVADPAGVL